MSSMLCAIVKNEAPYLVEWVIYHRWIGFDLIVLYENESTDDTPDVLARMRRVGAIDACVPWPVTEVSPQLSAYHDAALGCPTDWLMFLDADEFLMLKRARSVNAFIGGFAPAVSCISVNWRLFGSSGESEFSPRPVLERFRRASAVDCSINRHVKSLFRPGLVKQVNMHAPLMKEGQAVLANGAPLEMKRHGEATAVDWSVAQVNHYFCKSRAEYLVKRARGRAGVPYDSPEKFAKYTDASFDHHDRNNEIDDSAAAFLPDLGAMCADLRRRMSRA